MLKRIKRNLLLACMSLFAMASYATNSDPLFVSLTSDEPHRATMALNFSKHHAANGHPLSVFLSDKGVYLGVKASSSSHPEQQRLLAEMIASGSTVIMCPPCLRHYGFTEADLLPGIKLGGAKVTGEALFRPNTKTLSW
ncbi:MAG: DsrE family protein [Polynucleobacter sp.]|jgi:sulfur relay (sulfurtransferase) complex TusBCD TusD component (DsrE family)|nr:DsrE family protein [Polynucleobacter sp.]